MTFDEFRESTATIEQFYEKSLNPTQVQVWFEELKHYQNGRYKRAIQKVLRTSQFKPTLSVIIEAIKSVGEETKEREHVPCKACKGSGFVWYKKQVAGGLVYDYVCQCNCPNGIGLDYDGRKCKDEKNRSDYYLPKAEEIFLGGKNA